MNEFVQNVPYGILLLFFLFNANVWTDKADAAPAKALIFGGGSFLLAILMVVLMNSH